MTRLAEVPQRRGSPPQIKRGHRQRPQRARVKQFGQVEHVLVHPGMAGLEEVEGAVAHARVFLGDHIGVADVGLAHLQEHAAGCDQP